MRKHLPESGDLRSLELSGRYRGKGQGSLPVSDGAPHIRIRDVIIGGE